MRIEYHRTLIADHVRNAAFLAALKSYIVPGETVVADIGTGTGLLGMIAARLGAKRVYMYEAAAVGAVAERSVKKNRLGRICEVIAGHSTDMIDPPQVDLVVSETLGNYAFEEDIIATLADAVDRHLKPGGVLIPSRVTQYVAPVISGRIHLELTAWSEPSERLGLALDLNEARALSMNNAYVRTISAAELLDAGASARVWDTVDFFARPAANRGNEIAWKLKHPATIYGFAGWWSATLSPENDLSTAPEAPRTHWEQLYFPLDGPISVAPREEVRLKLRSRSSPEAGTHLSWSLVHCDAKGVQKARFNHDLDKGYLP